MLWILGTGAQWRDLPAKYPHYQTCHRRFQQWVKIGALQKALRRLAEHLQADGRLNTEAVTRIWCPHIIAKMINIALSHPLFLPDVSDCTLQFVPIVDKMGQLLAGAETIHESSGLAGKSPYFINSKDAENP